MAWAVERKDGGRGFGFTGGHFHDNWGNDDFRKTILNALVWVAKGDVPANGVESKITKADLEKEVQDLWVMDVATGMSTKLTSGKSREFSSTPVWSPDGSHLAFVAVRAGIFGLYRVTSDGKGTEELIYQLPGIANGEKRLFVGDDGERLVATVMLTFPRSWTSTLQGRG